LALAGATGRQRTLFGDERGYHLVHPRHMIELVERFPEYGVELLRLGFETRDPEFIGYWREVGDHLAHRGFVEHLIDREPEAALDLMEVLSLMGDSRFGPEIAERVFVALDRSGRLQSLAQRRPELLLHLSDSLPDGAVEYMWDRFGDELLGGLMSGSTLMDMTEHRPQNAVLLFRRVVSTTSGGMPTRVRRAVREWLADPQLFFAVSDKNSAVGRELLQVVMAHIKGTVGARKFLDQVAAMFKENGRLNEFLVTKPLIVLDLIEMSRVVNASLMLDGITAAIVSLAKSPERIKSLVQNSSIALLGRLLSVLRGMAYGDLAETIEKILRSELAAKG
jgi:hypothetical protein